MDSVKEATQLDLPSMSYVHPLPSGIIAEDTQRLLRLPHPGDGPCERERLET